MSAFLIWGLFLCSTKRKVTVTKNFFLKPKKGKFFASIIVNSIFGNARTLELAHFLFSTRTKIRCPPFFPINVQSRLDIGHPIHSRPDYVFPIPFSTNQRKMLGPVFVQSEKTAGRRRPWTGTDGQ
jgi:hypothetical protein